MKGQGIIFTTEIAAKSRRDTSPADLTLGLSHNETIMKRPTQSRNFLGNTRKSGTSNITVGGKFAWQPTTFYHLDALSDLV